LFAKRLRKIDIKSGNYILDLASNDSHVCSGQADADIGLIEQAAAIIRAWEHTDDWQALELARQIYEIFRNGEARSDV
jgi:hypothetical protein